MTELPKSGCETILVAEDDEALRKLAESVLSEFGYCVIVARDGDDAVEKFITNRDSIRLAVIDMIMPGKNGKEVYDIIKPLKPELKVLFASGYTADIINDANSLDENTEFIMKPLSPIEMLRKIREMLDRG